MNYEEAKSIAFEHVTPRVGQVLSEYANPMRVRRVEGGRVFYSYDRDPNNVFSTDARNWAVQTLAINNNHVHPSRPWPRPDGL